MNFDRIIRPTMVVDLDKCSDNIDRIHEKARRSGVIFRPHFKTHQSLRIGSIFREKGTEKITVSSVSMADYFSSGGWRDITIAFPFNPREFNSIKQINTKCRLCLTVTGTDSATALERLADEQMDVMIKIV